MFTDKEHRGPFAFSEELGNLSIGTESGAENIIVSAQRVEENDKDLLLLGTSEKEEIRVPTNNVSAYSAPTYDTELLSLNETLPANSPQASSAFDDLLLGLGLPIVPNPNPTPSLPPLKLNAKAVLEPSTFQQKWRQLPISISQVHFQNYFIFTNDAFFRLLMILYFSCMMSRTTVFMVLYFFRLVFWVI